MVCWLMDGSEHGFIGSMGMRESILVAVELTAISMLGVVNPRVSKGSTCGLASGRIVDGVPSLPSMVLPVLLLVLELDKEGGLGMYPKAMYSAGMPGAGPRPNDWSTIAWSDDDCEKDDAKL